MSEFYIKSIYPSIFVRRSATGLEQMLRVTVSSFKGCSDVELIAEYNGAIIGKERINLNIGENKADFFIEESSIPRKIIFKLFYRGYAANHYETEISPPRHWTVHVIQTSHHDPGYTDLASNVLKEQAQNLIKAINHAEQTAHYPDDAKFRIVIEQIWSLNQFFNIANQEQKDKMIGLLQSGQFEMTALFGNMVTEICGHETLIRTA